MRYLCNEYTRECVNVHIEAADKEGGSGKDVSDVELCGNLSNSSVREKKSGQISQKKRKKILQKRKNGEEK